MKTTNKPGTSYQSGFGNHFESEAIEGALPRGQNSPQKVPFGLYAEQLSGSSFTANRHDNMRSWLYRIRPSVTHSKFELVDSGLWRGAPFNETVATPNQLRWNPLPSPEKATDFLDGIVTIAGNGDTGTWRGSAVHLYHANSAMGNKYLYNADGELLIVPQQGELELLTEFGAIHVLPGEISVIPRGVKFQANPLDGIATGYICENFGLPLRLPTLGLIGSNGLANTRDFLSPSARYEEDEKSCQLFARFQGNLFRAEMDHSPLDVVAWHGNYVPYKYDLSKFQTVNSVSFDHSDPSIFTVLSSPSEIPGYANVDFVIFPPRWMVAENTFRPPFYHRNIMSEYMGLIHGVYDAKEDGFVPGGGSLHNAMSAHGPDASTFEKASNAELKPVKMESTLAFMFESSLVFHPTKYALDGPLLQPDYLSCWQGLKPQFSAQSKK